MSTARASGILTAITPAALRRRIGKSAQIPALRLAAGRDGRADAGLRADPRRDDGHGRRLHGRARSRSDLRRLAPIALLVVADVGARHRVHRRDDGPGADRHQEGAGLLDGQPARLHDARRSASAPSIAGDVPPDDARLLQGAAVPRRGQRDPRHRTTSRTCGRWAACSKYMPITYWTLFVGVAGHRGRPSPPGSSSKDEILVGAWHSGLPLSAAIVGWRLIAFMTAFYMFRLIFMTFHGEPQFDTARPRRTNRRW